jgi:hypothetical protein
MTKEEILFKITGVRYIHHTTYNATEVEMAMEKYTKQESIAFAEWIGDNYIVGTNGAWRNQKHPLKLASTEQLYEKYSQSKKQKT